MRHYNVILVFSRDGQRLLMCERSRPPYEGMLNLVGGKVEPGETGDAAAYRELFEETGITRADIVLARVMDFRYYTEDCLLETYAGKLKRPAKVHGDEHTLRWVNASEDFFDLRTYAGMGNIGHMVEQVRAYMGWMLEEGS